MNCLNSLLIIIISILLVIYMAWNTYNEMNNYCFRIAAIFGAEVWLQRGKCSLLQNWKPIVVVTIIAYEVTHSSLKLTRIKKHAIHKHWVRTTYTDKELDTEIKITLNYSTQLLTLSGSSDFYIFGFSVFYCRQMPLHYV